MKTPQRPKPTHTPCKSCTEPANPDTNLCPKCEPKLAHTTLQPKTIKRYKINPNKPTTITLLTILAVITRSV